MQNQKSMKLHTKYEQEEEKMLKNNLKIPIRRFFMQFVSKTATTTKERNLALKHHIIYTEKTVEQ